MRLTHPLLTTALATLVAATAVVLVPSSSAWAGNGSLWINGRRHHNPSGCFTVMGRLSMTNRTNTAAILYRGDRCNSRILGALGPEQRNTWEFVGSVYVQ
ncbi:hypothetical protein [Streptosporangium saharense]|uniref:Secreted protein n=1 Tax=Streptosporangium saharense TaxID=1706840 RepID=A0A7W7QI36_9ACTN|nr:hypothetical protein [Streptosporangium saharense]MBB4913804.1 hypothetical protein [Streptosporangium saharense]